MSGGSWDYFYRQVEDVGHDLVRDGRPSRAALGRHLIDVAKALHDIEWVDSADYAQGEEEPAIAAVLTPEAMRAATIRHVRDACRHLLEVTDDQP